MPEPATWYASLGPVPQPPALLDEDTPPGQHLGSHQHHWRIDGTCTGCCWGYYAVLARAQAEKEGRPCVS